MSTTVGSHSGVGPLSLMSCVRESSPLQDFETDVEKNVVSKRKFWNPKKWFRKKQKANDDVVVQEHRDVDGIRSRSTSELSVDEEPTNSHEVRSTSSMHPGLSVSHDSVFHPLNSGSSDLGLDGAQSSSSLSISQPLGDAKLQTELSSRLRLRRGRGDTSEDDEGLPRSPPCGSPAAATDSFLILEKTANKDLPTKSHSTCSDGSLLSMDSSEMDEDSVGQQSRHSSKVSLYEKRTDPDSDLELGPSFSTTPLNHSAAHHRVSVRPKRTYGAPRRKKGQSMSSALPATPEVNEESLTRSISPEVISRAGITPPSSESFRIKRSKLNAGRCQDDTALFEDEREEKLTLFERIFPRRSGKKKKRDEKVKESDSYVKEEEKNSHVSTTVMSKSYTESSSFTTSSTQPKREDIKPIIAPRTGAAARQRIQPIDIPATPKDVRDSSSGYMFSSEKPMSPDRSFTSGTSPIQVELENVLRHRQNLSHQSSSPILDTPPQSPKSPRQSHLPVISKTEYTSYSSKTSYSEVKQESKYSAEDIRSRIKIAGLSPLQQRVLSLNENSDNEGFKSLTDFAVKPSKPVVKSHSFKSKITDGTSVMEVDEATNEKLINKASSLDSVKTTNESEYNEEPKPEIIPPQTVEKEQEIEVVEVKEHTIDPDVEMPISPIGIGKFFGSDGVTISGPSHTAVVNIKSAVEEFSNNFNREEEIIEKDDTKKLIQKESQVSVTKIQLKHEATHITRTSVTIPKQSVPEFLNKQLNKVEVRPSSNIIFSMKSPRLSEDQSSRPKTLFTFPPIESEKPKLSVSRSSSKEEDNVDNKDTSPKTPPPHVSVTPFPPNQQKFKKNDSRPSSRKSSVISVSPESPVREKPLDKSRSASLDSLKSTSADKSSQDSLDMLEKKASTDNVVLRRKSLQRQKNEEEPELMKVFARRSLKLKDTDIEQLQEALEEQKQRDSDKENLSESSPESDRAKEEPSEVKQIKQPLSESKKATDFVKNIAKEESEVQMRKTLNGNIFIAQRAVSLNAPKVVPNDYPIKKQASLNDKRRDHWVKKAETEKVKESEEIISSKVEEVTIETNNFSKRKAEWEKRAQQAQK